MNHKKQILLLLLFAAPLFWVALNAQENRTVPTGSFKMQGIVGDFNRALQAQNQNIKTIIVTDLPAEQVKKECSFFGGDSLIGFDFTKASKQALSEGDDLYVEFQVFMFRHQTEFVKKKYHIKALPFEIEEARKIITPPSILSGPCNNIDFENGNFAGWVTSRGVNKNSRKPLTVYKSPANTSTNQGLYTCNDLNIISSTYGNDPMSNVPGLDPFPLGGKYSVRVGGPDLNLSAYYSNGCYNSQYYNTGPSNGEELSQTFVVTAANDLISFDYSVILNAGNHDSTQQPYFHVSVTDQAGNILDSSCTNYYVEAIKNAVPADFILVPGQTSSYYLPWKTNSINLSPYIGQTVVLSFAAAGCTQGAHFAYAYVDASCGPAQINTQSVCGGSTATLTAPASYGGSYSWSGPTIIGISTGQTVVVGSGGTYSVTVTPAPPKGAKCGYTLTTIVSFSTLTSSISSISNVACKGVHSGSASVSPNGGIPAYTYSWSNGQTTSAVTGLGAGTYSVHITDAGGCKSTSTVTITQPTSVLKDTIAAYTQSTCTLSTGSAKDSTYGGTPGYTYVWIPGGQTTATATGLSPGTYSVHVTDANGCPSTSSVTITIPAANGPTVTPTVSSNVLCKGGSDGSAIATVNGGQSPFTYSWSSGQTTSAVTGLSSGTYTIDVTDANGCSFVSTLSVSQPSLLATTISNTNISCNGQTNGIAIAHPSGGTAPYTYSWNSSPGQTTKTASNLGVGAYTVSVTDFNGCTSTQSITISEPQAITAGITSAATQCYGDSTGTATVGAPNGGSSPYTYTWNSNPVQSGNQALGLPEGIYSVLITDAHGCQATQSVAVTQPNQITYSITPSGYGCGSVGHGVISVTGVGGGSGVPYSYSWSNGDSVPTISNLTNGYYIVTVTDPHGCIVQKGATIQAAPVPTNNAILSGVSCNGLSDGGAIANASGGTGPLTYLWLPSGQTTPAITGLSAGTYTISVVDSLGCSLTNTVTVTQPAVLYTAITSVGPCIGLTNGSATANPTGGTQPYTYLWGTSPPQTLLTANNLGAGTYSVAVTDAHGCLATQSITLTDPADILAPIGHTDPPCNGYATGTAFVGNTTGGYGQYTYTWITNPVQNGPLATGLPAGTYSVLVTDSHGCHPTQPFTATISEPTAVTYTATMSGSSCGPYGLGVASVPGVIGGTGPYSYLWSNGNTTTSISYLSSGTYVVTVFDANNCSASQSLTLPASVQPQADFTFTESLSCEGITVQFTNLSQQETGHTWYFDVNSSSTEQDPVHTYTSSGTYWAILAVANPPCVDTMAKVITVGNFIPQNMGATNIFTPNGDGDNDCFTLVPGDTSATTAYAVRNCLSVEIFDRWGVKMYESVGADNCWDGKNKKDNKPAAEGTYFYVAKVGKTVIKGFVTLMR